MRKEYLLNLEYLELLKKSNLVGIVSRQSIVEAVNAITGMNNNIVLFYS